MREDFGRILKFFWGVSTHQRDIDGIIVAAEDILANPTAIEKSSQRRVKERGSCPERKMSRKSL